MKICDLLSMCLGNLWHRKLRTFLTVIGVVIGTCAIVVMISLGVGINQAQMDMLAQMGDLTLITVYRDWENQDLALDANAVAQMNTIEGVEVATPFQYLWDQFCIVANDRYKYQGQVVAVNKLALEKLGYETSDGRLFLTSDGDGAMVIGGKALYQFYDTKRKKNNYVDWAPDEFGNVKPPFVDTSDKFTININETDHWDMEYIPHSKTFKANIVGTLSDVDQDNYQFDKSYTIYIDIEFANKLIKEYNKVNDIKESTGGQNGAASASYDNVYVKASSIDTVEAVDQAIKEMGFQTYSLSSTREELQKSSRTIQLILGGIGGISLLVAALGITNTMIMSIYERTREIGIMKVIGCRVRDIRTLFMMESGCIGLLGGILGLAFSYAISYALNLFLGGGAGGGIGGIVIGGMGTQVSIIPFWLALFAVCFAVAVGLLSGIAPANRAVKISALEAIKHE